MAAVEAVEGAFAAVGGRTPLGRFAVATMATAAVLNVIAPNTMFHGDTARPWSITAPEDSEATNLPWWVVAFAAGAISALFL